MSSTEPRDDIETMSIGELSALVLNSPRQLIVGFAFSSEIYAHLAQCLPHDHSKEVFLGAPFIVDKTLAPAQFDVAFTQAGWKRLLDRAR